MLRKQLKKVAFILMLALVTPTIQSHQISVIEAKTVAPKLNVTKKTIYGIGKKYTIKVNNLTTGSKSSWSSSNKKVATITGKGVVTTVGAGSSNIKVTVTLPNKTKKVLYCTVTVKLRPATGVVITNIPENNTIEVGNSNDYNRTLTPSNSTDKTTFKIKDTSVATVNSKGIVTGVSEGSTVLTATTTSGVSDSVPIIVTPKTAKVDKVILVNGSELQIIFSDTINASTVLNNGELINVKFNRVKDEESVLAGDYGTLTGSLSTDLKTLTITSTSVFNGKYEVEIPSTVKTVSGLKLEKYEKVLTIKDTFKPVNTGVSLEDTGVLATITFNEPISIDKLIPALPKRLDGVALSSTSLSLLANKNNYILSSDKKSLRIDLTDLALVDKGREIVVQLIGIQDLSGNSTNDIYVTLTTDTTVRPQSKIVNAYRSSYNEITVQYDRAIRTPGSLEIANLSNSAVTGIVDKDNNKLVRYSLVTAATQLTGNQVVYVKNFNGYNTYSTGYESKMIDFTIRTTAPTLISSILETNITSSVETNKLTLTFDKDVTLVNSVGEFESTLYALNEDVSSIKVKYISGTANKKQITLILDNTSISASGTYDITIPSGLVKDAYHMGNDKKVITVKKSTGSMNELPAPTITQLTGNPSEILLTFTKKIDKTSAEDISNYYIPGAVIYSAKVISNSSTGATVKLTIISGTIQTTAEYPVVISGVKGANNTYAAMTGTPQLIKLVENVAPTVVSAKISSDFKTIIITFNENIKGTPSYEVYQANTALPLNANVLPYISGNRVAITLDSYVTNMTNIYIKPTLSNLIVDLNNNSLGNDSIAVTY